MVLLIKWWPLSPHWAWKSETNFRRDDELELNNSFLWMLPHRPWTLAHWKYECLFFSSSPMNLFSFAKRKHGPSNKIWASHHMARETAVTQKVDAVALKAQKTVLSTSVKTPKLRTFSAREKRVNAEFLLLLVFKNRLFSHVLYTE